MKRLSLEYGKTYEIPVTFESEKITSRLLHGVIHVKERISYMTVFVSNDDDLHPLKQDEEISIDMIRCYPREAGRHLLLVDCTFYTRPQVFGGHTSQYHVYFNYLFNGCANIETKKDLRFNEIELYFENLDIWLRHYLPDNIEYDTPLFECNIETLDARFRFYPVEFRESEKGENRRTWKTTHDVKISLAKNKGKFKLEDLRHLVTELEALFSCLTATGCFCTQSNLRKNRRRPTKHKDFYNVHDVLRLAEPKHKLGHSFYSLLPYPLSDEVDFAALLNGFFESNQEVRNLMRKVASIFLYEERFLYDVKFLYIATLLQTAYYACAANEPYGEGIRFNEKLQTECLTLSDDQLACIKKIAKKYFKATPQVTYMDNLNRLLAFQYDDCILVDFNEIEKKYIKDNRNLMGHGASLAYDDTVQHHDILQRVLVLLLYTVFKTLGIPSHILRNRLVASASQYLQSVNKEALSFLEANKIYIAHEQFLEIKNSKIDLARGLCTVVERCGDQHRVNLVYTEYFNRDHIHIEFLKHTTDVLRCYYREEDLGDIKYVSQTYLVDETSPENYIKPFSLAVVELKKPLEEVTNYLNDSLIPTAASDCARKEKIPILKAYRITKGLSIGELAQSTGLSASTISRYENTYRPPDRNTYQIILKNLGTDISLIFDEQKKKQAKYKKTKRDNSRKVRK